ncbi:hypothetical protein EYC80_003918 [Monilinia laxa]|uniref:Uncharacterized protein n=1 Tax=Monilinia laxa TaxID=61186 RepID=A0A5N6KLG7_MONLA|nr:hypothetical protein EYC80_003918 [Monilinia laxa]
MSKERRQNNKTLPYLCGWNAIIFMYTGDLSHLTYVKRSQSGSYAGRRNLAPAFTCFGNNNYVHSHSFYVVVTFLD